MNAASMLKRNLSEQEQSLFTQAIAVSLEALPPSVQQLNRTYIDHVSRRSLISAEQACHWLGSDVSVFLRHDKVCVFAIVSGNAVAMADFVTLADAKLHVDPIGQSQSNAELGPLPNKRTVHAFLTGRLLEICDDGDFPDPESWAPVIYHPLKCSAFVFSDSQQPVLEAREVRLVPGAAKVWCPKQRELTS